MLEIILDNNLLPKCDNIKYDSDLVIQKTLNLKNNDMYYSAYEHSKKMVKQETKNNFLNAFLTAYNYHLPIKIRPDDISLIIKFIISTCINNNAEKMRDIFVSHEKTKNIEVFSCYFDLNYITNLFKNKIQENIKNKDFVDNFCTSYSTTTNLIDSVSNITLMNTLKEYFTYSMLLGCGIPTVILEGTIEDWNKLQQFYNYFKNLLIKTELEIWFSHFDVIINMFIEMRNLQDTGKVDAPSHIKELWKRVISYVPYGSGGQTFLGGWIRLFMPYNPRNQVIKFDKYIKCLDLNTIAPDINNNISYEQQDEYIKYYIANDWDIVSKSFTVTPCTIQPSILSIPIDAQFYSGFFNPRINEDNLVSLNIGIILSEDKEKLKKLKREEYINSGVVFNEKDMDLKIPYKFKNEAKDIIKLFGTGGCCMIE
jgi:hypothetical protein